MNQCLCYKQDGKRCSNTAKPNSPYCGVHKKCRFPVKTNTPQQVRQQVRKEKNQNIKKLLIPTQDKKQDIYRECGKKCCPLGDDRCSFSLCKKKDCVVDCSMIEGARLKNNLAHKRAKIPDQERYKRLSVILKQEYQKRCKK
jgi:hypothetical protein